jgi:hypothetical protein
MVTQNTCSVCKAPSIKKMCPAHLALAAKKFRELTAKRRALGQCVKCTRKGAKLPDGTRSVHCRLHRAANASKCRTWGEENRRRVWAERKERGVCVVSPNHGPPASGHVYCSGCRYRMGLDRNRRAKAQGVRVHAKPRFYVNGAFVPVQSYSQARA